MIFLPLVLLFLTALILIGAQIAQPNHRFAWWIGVAGTFLAWLWIWLWLVRLPLSLQIHFWEATGLPFGPAILTVDRANWPYALALTTLALAILLTEVVRDNFPSPFSWAGSLTLIGLGILAVMADTPLVLVLIWTAIDLTDLITQLLTGQERQGVERVILGFGARLLGTGVLIRAGAISLGHGTALDLRAPLPAVWFYLILAAGLRLGVLPLHLGFSAESALRRGFGTALRLVAATSSLVVLARLPGLGETWLFALLLILVAGAGLYGGWNWLRVPDDLNGRPFWLIGWAALAMAAALRGNGVGATAWGLVLTLVGATLFLSFPARNRLQQVLTGLGLWGMSSFPFSPTATGWEGVVRLGWLEGISAAMLVATQALLALGFVRKMLWLPTGGSDPLKELPDTFRRVYSVGIALPIFVLILLGGMGWLGALRLGVWWMGLVVAGVGMALFWLTPRWRLLSPIRAHWVRPNLESTRLDALYRSLGQAYSWTGRLIHAFTALLEGEGGMLWVLLFFVLFLSLFSARLP